MLQKYSPERPVSFQYKGEPGDGNEASTKRYLWTMTYQVEGEERCVDLTLRKKQILECLSQTDEPMTINDIAESLGFERHIVANFIYSDPTGIIPHFVEKTRGLGRNCYFELNLNRGEYKRPTRLYRHIENSETIDSGGQTTEENHGLYLLSSLSLKNPKSQEVVYIPDYLGEKIVSGLVSSFQKSTEGFQQDKLSKVWVWVGVDMGHITRKTDSTEQKMPLYEAGAPDMIL